VQETEPVGEPYERGIGAAAPSPSELTAQGQADGDVRRAASSKIRRRF
jgi:hypothetical protein